MKKKKRGKWLFRLIIIFICVAVAFAAAWGILEVLDRLSQYSEGTKIEKDPVEEIVEEKPGEPDGNSPEKDALPVNEYESSGFKNVEGIRTYEFDGVTGVAGIDVSSYQTHIDWNQVKASGIEFAMIRVGYRGYTTGKLDLDNMFLSHIDGALDAGLDVGVYFFSQALTPEEAMEEAQYVLTWIEGYDISYPVVFDWEEVDAVARTDEMNMPMLTSCAEAFCRTIEEAGYRAAVYFNQAYGYMQFNLVSLRDYEFWLAEYADAPSFVYDFKMWQYTNEGRVPGIEGNVDLNIYFKK